MIQALRLLIAHLVGFLGHARGLLRGVLIQLFAFATNPWRMVFWFPLYLYFSLWGCISYMFVNILSMPSHILTSLRREKQLESKLQEADIYLAETTQLNTKLEQKLDMIAKDHKRIRELLKKAEDREAILIKQVQFLQVQAKDAEHRNFALKARDNKISKAIHEKNGKEDQDSILQPSDEGADSAYNPSVDTQLSVSEGYLLSCQRRAAFSSSIFTVALSMVVAMISLESQDPCTPLFIALFIVASVSLTSVAKLFPSLHRPGFDAFVLLCLHWFILGALTYPALPNAGKYTEYVTLKFSSWSLGLLGFDPEENLNFLKHG